MTTFTLCKKIIENQTYKSKDDILLKLDVFLLNDRLTQAEYEELMQLLAEKPIVD